MDVDPIIAYYNEIIDGVDVLILNTTYSGLPTGIFNLLLSCRLKDLNSTSPLAFLDYDNCTLYERENGDYVVTFKISLDDIVNQKLCSFTQSTTEERIFFLYTCQVDQWFLKTEALPNSNAAIFKMISGLQLSVDSNAKHKIYFSSNQVRLQNGSYVIVKNVNTTSHMCNINCDGTDPGKSILLAGKNITAQIKIDGALANAYLMSLLSVELQFENKTSYSMKEEDCTQISPFNIPGEMQLTCKVTISGENLVLEILIKLDPVTRRGRELEEEKIDVLRSIIGPYTICDMEDEECKKKMVDYSEIIEEELIEVKVEEQVDEKEGNEEDKGNSEKDKIIIGLAVGVFVAIIIIILVIIYFIRRLSRAKTEGKTPAEMKEEIQTKGIDINMETEQDLKEEGLPNQI